MSDFDLEPGLLVKEEISSANILEVTVGTNAPCGGDYGHGARTHFELANLASTAWEVEIRGEKLSMRVEDPKAIVIRLGGDCEADTLIEALEFAAMTLRRQQQINKR